jgi:hypothetical protein
MGRTLYKDHIIVNSGRPFSRREASGGFVAVASISWQTRDGAGDVHLLSLNKLYATEAEASAAALEEARAWVDRHVNRKNVETQH